mmetsp:Transcript_71822/g.181521  ORF Transcript_71822/g.181521 Transcript_71822/m.181521 type:complete len:225 (+) Transcript_71822:674-1348(+)
MSSTWSPGRCRNPSDGCSSPDPSTAASAGTPFARHRWYCRPPPESCTIRAPSPSSPPSTASRPPACMRHVQGTPSPLPTKTNPKATGSSSAGARRCNCRRTPRDPRYSNSGTTLCHRSPQCPSSPSVDLGNSRPASSSMASHGTRPRTSPSPPQLPGQSASSPAPRRLGLTVPQWSLWPRRPSASRTTTGRPGRPSTSAAQVAPAAGRRRANLRQRPTTVRPRG